MFLRKEVVSVAQRKTSSKSFLLVVLGALFGMAMKKKGYLGVAILAFIAGFMRNVFNIDVLQGTRVSEAAVQMSWNVAMGASAKGSSDCIKAFLTDFRPDLAKIDIPILVVHGTADRAGPFEVSGKRTHEMIPGSQLVLIEEGQDDARPDFGRGDHED